MLVMDQLYTTQQIAEILQIHHLTVLKYINAGDLKAIKLGRVYRITQASLKEFLEAQTN